MTSKKHMLMLLPFAALLALAACNGGGDDGDQDGGASATPEATATLVPSPPPEVCPKIDDEVVQSMVALLEIDQGSYTQGDAIDMTLRLINCASRPITRNYTSAQRYDFVVATEDGDELWRWSEGMTFDEIEATVTYQPSEELTFSESWDQTNNDEGQAVEPGQYQLSAESSGCDESLQNCGPAAARFIDIVAP